MGPFLSVVQIGQGLLLSAWRRSPGPTGLIQGLGPFTVLYEEVFFREVKMSWMLSAKVTDLYRAEAEALIGGRRWYLSTP